MSLRIWVSRPSYDRVRVFGLVLAFLSNSTIGSINNKKFSLIAKP